MKFHPKHELPQAAMGFIKDQEHTPPLGYGLLDPDTKAFILEEIPLQGMMLGFIGVLAEDRDNELQQIFQNHVKGDNNARIQIVRRVMNHFLQDILRGDA